MPFSKKVGLLCALLVAVLLPGSVMAEDITTEKQLLIRQNCSASQFTIDQLQKRDAVSRINRGRSYDQLMKQINAFNNRFSANKVATPDTIAQTTSDIQASMDRFRASYDRYYDDLSNALKTDCKVKPIDFYQFVQRARDDRAAIGNEVTKLDDLLGNYRSTLLRYQATLTATSPGAKQ